MAIGAVGQGSAPAPELPHGGGNPTNKRQQPQAPQRQQQDTPAAEFQPTIPQTYSQLRLTNGQVSVTVVDADNDEILLEYPATGRVGHIDREA